MEFDIKKMSTANATSNSPYFVAKVSCVEGIDLKVCLLNWYIISRKLFKKLVVMYVVSNFIIIL